MVANGQCTGLLSDCTVQVCALAGVNTVHSWVRHLTNTLAILLSTQVYKFVALNFHCGDNPATDWHLIHAMETWICSGDKFNEDKRV